MGGKRVEAISGIPVLGERLVLVRDPEKPNIGRLEHRYYLPGRQNVDGGHPHQGWTGEETEVVEPVQTHDPILIRSQDRAAYCTFCDQGLEKEGKPEFLDPQIAEVKPTKVEWTGSVCPVVKEKLIFKAPKGKPTA